MQNNDALANADILDALACTIDKRPAGAPGIFELEPFVTQVRREADSLIVGYTAQGSGTIEAFVAAERLCCNSIEWNLNTAGTLRIAATPEQTDVLAEVFRQLYSGRS